MLNVRHLKTCITLRTCKQAQTGTNRHGCRLVREGLVVLILRSGTVKQNSSFVYRDIATIRPSRQLPRLQTSEGCKPYII